MNHSATLKMSSSIYQSINHLVTTLDHPPITWQTAPALKAKGAEELAEEILRIARDCEVPIYENAELVRLLARMELGGGKYSAGALSDDCRDQCVCVEFEGEGSGGAGAGLPANKALSIAPIIQPPSLASQLQSVKA